MSLEGTLAGPGIAGCSPTRRVGPPSHTPSPAEESIPTPAFSEAPLRNTTAIKAPLCVSGEAGLGVARGAHKGPRSCVFANRGAELCRGAESSNCL